MNFMILKRCGEAHATRDFLDGCDNMIRQRQINDATAPPAQASLAGCGNHSDKFFAWLNDINER